MKFAASLTVTGILGLLLLEALKFILAPVGVWLLGVVMLVTKVLVIGVGLSLAVAVGVFVYKRVQRSGERV